MSLLDDGETTVGTHVCVSHEGPAWSGEQIRIEYHLQAVERRRITFEVEASSARGLISRGTHERAVIDLARYESQAPAKEGRHGNDDGQHQRRRSIGTPPTARPAVRVSHAFHGLATSHRVACSSRTSSGQTVGERAQAGSPYVPGRPWQRGGAEP